MANTKEYKIVINGITESVKAVESLNRELASLEARIKALEGKSVGVKTSYSGGGSKSSSSSALSEEEKLAKQIEQIDAKRVAYSKEIYQSYLAAKDVLKETVKDQNAIAAAERLQAKAYSNTMMGMKQELADIKAAMQTVDLGDTDQMDKMVQRANELNEALKKIEEAYGQFGRNVGNYKSAFDGLEKVTITVGGVVREFNSAREASKTLKNELIGLEAAGSGNTEVAKELRSEYYKLKSAMDDATKSSRAMDQAMDYMQSFASMASIGSGIQAFFGFDDNEITKSIQKLVALQGVLKGIESLRKQMETGEGFGKIFKKGFGDIDKYTYSLRRANVALRGTGTSARIAAAGIKVLNYALKGLMTLGVIAAVDLLVEGLRKLVSGVQDWVKGDADLVDASEVMKTAIDAQNKVLQQNIELINKAQEAQRITESQAKVMIEREYAKAIAETSKNLKVLIEGLKEVYGLQPDKLLNLNGVMGDKGVTWVGGFKDAIKSIDDFNKRFDDLETRVAHGNSLKSFFSSADDAKDEFAHLTKIVGMDFVAAMNKFADGTTEGTKRLVEYIDQMDKLTGGRYSKAIQLVKLDNEGLQQDINNAWTMIQNFKDNVANNPIVISMQLDAKINSELDKLDPKRAIQRNIDQWTETLVFGIDDAGNKLTDAQRKNIEKIIAAERKRLSDIGKQQKSAGKDMAAEAERVEREINQLRIANMKEGLEKTKAQLEEERRVRLAEAKKTGIRVAEQEALINQLYNKKIEDAEKEHAKNVQQVINDMWEQIYRSSNDTLRMNLDTQLVMIENSFDEAQKFLDKNKFNSRYASYGGLYVPNEMNDKLRRDLGLDIEAKSQGPIDDAMIKMAKEYLDLLEEIEKREKIVVADDKTYEEAQQDLEDWLKANRVTAEQMEEMWTVQELKQMGYTKSLETAYQIRISDVRDYYLQLEALERKHSEYVKENELSALTQDTNVELEEQKNRYGSQLAMLEENKEKGLLTEEKYNELRKEAEEKNDEAIKAIQTRFHAEAERLEQDHQNRLKEITANGLRGMLNEYRDAFDKISTLGARQPQKAKGILGDMGFINVAKTKESYNQALEAFKKLSIDILNERQELQNKFDRNEITFDDFQQAKRELDGLEQDIIDSSQDIEENLKNVEGVVISSINQWVQKIGSQISSLMNSIWEYQSYMMDKEQNELDKWNEELDKRLQEQEEIVESHKNKVDSIEDELSEARGERRQHLIDQLNSEMEAQRAALAEEKRIEKEKEAAEKRQEQLEKKRRKQEYDMKVKQAFINWHLSIASGLATEPFMPLGIAMGALATVLGAAQYALVKSQKPYAEGGRLDGGVAQGPRHSQGGIPVLGGRASIEGGEFITNRLTTSKNIELLDYINSKKKRVDINDLIDFYSSGKVKSNIKAISPQTKFATGGIIPTITANVDTDDRILRAIEAYNERNVVVSVQDINSRQEAVKNVQVLAGLE